MHRCIKSRHIVSLDQWHNRWGGGEGADCPPGTSHREISADLPGKKRQGKKGKLRKKKKENKKREGGKSKNERRKSSKLRRGLFFFFFFFAFHFSKPLKFVLGVPK